MIFLEAFVSLYIRMVFGLSALIYSIDSVISDRKISKDIARKIDTILGRNIAFLQCNYEVIYFFHRFSVLLCSITIVMEIAVDQLID